MTQNRKWGDRFDILSAERIFVPENTPSEGQIKRKINVKVDEKQYDVFSLINFGKKVPENSKPHYTFENKTLTMVELYQIATKGMKYYQFKKNFSSDFDLAIRQEKNYNSTEVLKFQFWFNKTIYSLEEKQLKKEKDLLVNEFKNHFRVKKETIHQLTAEEIKANIPLTLSLGQYNFDVDFLGQTYRCQFIMKGEYEVCIFQNGEVSKDKSEFFITELEKHAQIKNTLTDKMDEFRNYVLNTINSKFPIP